LGWLRSHVSRFANGPVHARRRALVIGELDRLSPDALRRATAAGASPVAALAAALGVRDVAAVERAVETVAPAYLTGESTGAVDDAVATLVAAFGGAVDERCAARIAILVQACLPTAALIASARRLGSVSAALIDEPPVRTTRRVALTAARGVAAGGLAVVDLGGAPFGAGPRPCPGEAHARALAEGALTTGS
jgi:hypothetical protein